MALGRGNPRNGQGEAKNRWGCGGLDLARGGGGLDEEAAFEDGLEDLEEGFAAAVEAVPEALFSLAKDVV